MAGIGDKILNNVKNKAKDGLKKITDSAKKFLLKIAIKIAIPALLVIIPFMLIIGIFFKQDDSGQAVFRYEMDENGKVITSADGTPLFAGELGEITNSTGTDWWWPIGSKETTTENGKLFASGTPVPCTITSGVGPRWGTSHNGIDIAPIAAWSIPGPYIISAADGKVIEAVDGFDDNGSLSNWDGNGFGNHIVIDYGDGITITYGHLSKNTVRVKVRRNSNIRTSYCKNGT